METGTAMARMFRFCTARPWNAKLTMCFLYLASISNLAASGGMVWAYLDQTVSPAYMTIYLVCGTLVCAGRQRHAFVELGKFLWPPAMRKKVV